MISYSYTRLTLLFGTNWSSSVFLFLIYLATLQVAALQFGDFYNVQYVKMYTFFMIQLQVISKTFTIFLPCK